MQNDFMSFMPILHLPCGRTYPLPRNCGLCVVASVKEVQWEKAREGKCTVEKTNKHNLSQGFTLASTVRSCGDTKCPWSDGKTGVLHLWRLPPKPTLSHHEKTIRETQIEGNFVKYLTSTPQNCQGHQKQSNSEKLPHPREAYGNVMTKCRVVS